MPRRRDQNLQRHQHRRHHVGEGEAEGDLWTGGEVPRGSWDSSLKGYELYVCDPHAELRGQQSGEKGCRREEC